MMVKSRLVVPLIAVLVLCASAGFAVTFTTYTWTLDEWKCSNNPIDPQIPCFAQELDWGETWIVNGEHIYQLTGPAPPSEDPAVSQSVRNRTATPWTDWHVEITNGTYDTGSAIVYNKNAPSPLWVIEPITNGFFAHVVSGMNTQVDYYEVLSVYFTYTVVDPLQPVSIQQYPTSTYPIPEPGSILGLLAGCLAFGFRVRRRA